MKLNINNAKDFEVIAKYLAGEMSNDEASQFETQIESFPENKIIILEMRNQWEQLGSYKNKMDVNTNKGWETLFNRMSSDELIPDKKIVEHRLTPVWVKWAASVILLMTIASLSFYSIFSNNPNLISLQTGTESNTLIQTLNDGSIVYLANNTTFSYPEQFSSSERKVNLKGEAYFDITPNPKKPFRIETDKVIVEVLGTAFNVKSESGNQFELEVERGKVRVTLKSDPAQSQIVLSGEKISTSNNHLVKRKSENSVFSLRKTKRIMFKDESLSNIVKVINKNYNSKIQLQSQQVGERKLTVIFHDYSLSQITEILSEYLNLKVQEKSDSTLIIKAIEK